MPSIVVFFLIIFASAFLIFAGIALVLSPDLFRTVRKSLRWFLARRHRECRQVLDRKQLDCEARALEGTYRFD